MTQTGVPSGEAHSWGSARIRAFGQVVKAEAIGITDFNPRDKSVETVRRRSKMFRRSSSSKLYQDSKGIPYMKTTVAVKTLKGNHGGWGGWGLKRHKKLNRLLIYFLN